MADYSLQSLSRQDDSGSAEAVRSETRAGEKWKRLEIDDEILTDLRDLASPDDHTMLSAELRPMQRQLSTRSHLLALRYLFLISRKYFLRSFKAILSSLGIVPSVTLSLEGTMPLQ